MMMIKAFYSGWKEADMNTAYRLFCHIMRVHDKKVFDNHFRGITYEELAAFGKRNG